MNMIINDFGSLQLNRTDPQHFTQAGGIQTEGSQKSKGFEEYLMEALNTVNNQQNDVSALQEKLITDPDSVDVHDVTIAMQKARMSLNLAQTVIDRLVTDWNEITTTR